MIPKFLSIISYVKHMTEKGSNNKRKRSVLMDDREKTSVVQKEERLGGFARPVGEATKGKAAENRGNVDHPENACGLPRDRLEMSPVSFEIVAFSNFSFSFTLHIRSLYSFSFFTYFLSRFFSSIPPYNFFFISFVRSLASIAEIKFTGGFGNGNIVRLLHV